MDEYEHYGPGQPVNAADVAAIIAERDRLLADRPFQLAAILALTDERDRLRAVVDAVLIWQRQMADLACAVDVLHVADLYRIVTAELDVSADMGGRDSTEGAPHQATGMSVSAHGAPDPPNGGPASASTPALQLGSDIETADMGGSESWDAAAGEKP